MPVATFGTIMRDLDALLQQFAGFILKARLAPDKAAPY